MRMMHTVATPDRLATPGTATRVVAALVVAGAGLLALGFGGYSISLVREQLHISCSMGQPGSEGADTWMCADGIGYLGVALTLGVMWLVAVLAGGLIAGLVRSDLAARVSLVLLSCASVAWVFGWTWYGATSLVGDEYSPLKGTGYWALAVGPAAAVSGIALIGAVLSLLAHGRAVQICCTGAALGLVLAATLQPGVGITVMPAAGLLGAAVLRARPV